MLRLATPADLPVVMPLVEAFYQHFGYSFERTAHQSLVARFLADERLGSCWLVLHDNVAVGYVMLNCGFTFEYGGRDAFVDELYVLDSHRNLGLGRSALLELQQRAVGLGLVAIHLQTEAYNGRAKRLYEAVGFRDKQRSTLTWLVADHA